MLTLAEELLLIALDDRTGRFQVLPEYSLELALGGAALMDLSLLDRVDSDLEHIQIVDAAPTGEPILDLVLQRLAQPGAALAIRPCLWELAETSELRERGLDLLVERGLVRRQERKRLGIFRSQRYCKVDGGGHREVEARVRATLAGEGIPEPRDAILVGLLHSCSLLPSLFDVRSVQAAWQRIELVVRFDMLGRQVLDTLRKLQTGVSRGR